MPASRPAEWSEETERRMRQAGWYPGRDAFSLVQGWRAKLSVPGSYKMFPAAENALREFGGIKVDIDEAGLERWREGFQIDPTLIGWDGSRFRQYEERVGVRVYPLGLASWGNCYLTIGEDGRVFLSMDQFMWFLGSSMEDAIEALLVGRKAPEILREVRGGHDTGQGDGD